MTDTLLDAKSLCAWYGAAQILYDMDLQVRRGEVVALLGRNGAGTSTTLKALMGMLDKLPGMSGLPDNVKDQMDDKLTVRMEAIISSMTPKERAHPDLIKGSRKRRIAAGSGMQVQDVNKLLKQFTEMQRMMKKMSGKGGMRKMMGQMKNMLPPGFGGGGRGPF